MVQQELHPSDEGRQGDGNPGEPLADETAARVPEALTGWTPEPAFAAQAQDAANAVEPGSELAAGTPPETVTPAPSPYYLGSAGPSGPPNALTRPRLAVVRDEIFAWCRTLVSAAVYATLIVTFVMQVARVEGQSMAPTLQNEDRLIVNKFAYLIGSPQPGDIVMMYYPADPDKSFVKRVIAREGDRVKIVDGVVYVNDMAMADDFVPPEYRSHEDYPETVVRPGHYWVLGDHRNNSSDSRDWGEVPEKYIVGKVQLRWWPIPNATIF